MASNAGIRLGGQLGGLVVGFGLNGFIVLFLTNALTYLAYVLILVTIVRKDARPEPSAGGYRAVLRDRPFIHLAITNMIIIAVGWGAFTWLLPPYAQKQVGLSPQQIGSLLLANAITVVVLQVSVARFAEGRRRVVIMALAGAIFSLACLLVVAAGLHPGIAYPVLVAAAIVVGTGKCFHTSVLILLVADLAPASLRGRFMAAIGLSWWAGLALAPSVGMRALSLSPKGAFLAAALLVTMAAVSAFALAPGLPAAARVTPHPGGRGVSVSSTKP